MTIETQTPARLIGKTVLVTGASGGLGLEAAIKLANAGANTVIVARNPGKLEAARMEIKQRAGSATVRAMLCDFSSQADIRRFAAEFLARDSRLDILVNNAGGAHAKRRLTVDGIEATFAVNHLGYFLLTHLLMERLQACAPARIVNVASAMHYKGTLDFDDLGFERGYTIMRAYARSKLANVLFTRELGKRLAGSGITVNAVHPGTVATHIWDGAPRWTQPFLALAKKFYMIPPGAGAQRLVYLATSPDVKDVSGLYFENDQPKPAATLARDDALAERLWRESECLVRASL